MNKAEKEQGFNLIQAHLQESIQVKQMLLKTLVDPIQRAGQLLIETLACGGKILSCGNGGSACDAQHFSHELVNRFESERRPLAAFALTADCSLLTAVANDYAYEQIFSKQIVALGRARDALLAISTSGNSPNILAAVEAAHEQGMRVIALTGENRGKLAALLTEQDVLLAMPSTRTCRIQEAHITVIHCLCSLIEQSGKSFLS